MNAPKTAKLINEGKSQLVALPDDIRLSGDEVEVVQSGETVTLRPVRKPITKEEFDAVFAEIDRLRGDHAFMPDGREQPPMPPDDDLASVE